MALLTALSGRSSEPLVTFRKPIRNQICIAFNAAFCDKAKLGDYEYMMVDLSGKTFTFTPSKESTHDGNRLPRLSGDGGKVKAGRSRVIWLSLSECPDWVAKEKGKSYPANVEGKSVKIKV